MVRRTLLMLITTLLLMAACSPGAAATEEPSPTTESTIAKPPVFFLLGTNGPPVPGQAGSYCWADICVDMEAPPYITSFMPIGTSTILIQAEPPAPNKFLLTLLPPNGQGEPLAQEEVIPDGDTIEWTPDVPPGQYVLLVHGTWNDGSDITYYFGVDTPITESDLPLPGDDDAPTPPALALILPDESEHPATQGTYCWSDDRGGLCADMIWPPMVEDTVAVAAGDVLEFHFVENPPPSLTMSLYDATGMDQSPPNVGDSVTTAEIEVSADGITTWTPDVPPGRYLLIAQAFWIKEDNTSQGDSMYVWLLDIQ